MTPAQACEVLGVSRGSSRSQIEQTYKSKRQKLQLQLVAGQSLSKREHAGQQMARLATAWEVLRNAPARPSGKPKTTPDRTGNRPGQALPNPFWPQPGGRPLADFVSLMPLPKTVTVLSLILLVLMVISMVHSCINTSINAFRTTEAKPTSQINPDRNSKGSSDRPATNTKNVEQLDKETKPANVLEI